MHGSSTYCGGVRGLNATRRDREERGVPIWNAGSRVATATARAAETLSTQRSSKDFTQRKRGGHIDRRRDSPARFKRRERRRQIQERPPKKKKQAAAIDSTAKLTSTRRSGFNLGGLGGRKQRPYAREINAGDSAGTAQAGLPVPRKLAQRMRPAICRISWRSGGKSDRTF